MDAQDCLQMLREIQDVSFATVGEDGLPHNRIIDIKRGGSCSARAGERISTAS